MPARTPRRTSSPHAMFRLMAVTMIGAAMMAAAVVTGTAHASAATMAPAATTTSKPVVGKVPLNDLIGQPVKHVTPPVIPDQYVGTKTQQKLPAGDSASCTAPKPGRAQCASVSRPVTASGSRAAAARASTAKAKPKSASAASAAAIAGYSPAQLQQAYSLTTASANGGYSSGTTPETVAIIGAYNDPTAASDLLAYQTAEGVVPDAACAGTGNIGSGCVKTVNEDNQTSPLPAAPTASTGDWTWAESADIDMVTAICPHCQILLVEANSNAVADLGQAAITAENDADFITGSWYTPEFSGETADDQAYFNAPGKALVFPSANAGYKSEWPAASQYVTAVGGTTLTADTSTTRGYTEAANSKSGSACTTLEPKPSWQPDTGTDGCPNRTENDVAATADNVAVYDGTAFTTTRSAGWGEGSGTVTAAAIITGAYALNGLPQAGTYPASYPYQSASSGDFNDITSGTSNGTCEPARQYLCNAETGYDAPTGEGTPDGAAGLAFHGSGSVISIPDPGTIDYLQGQPASIPVQAADSDPSAAITYSATGLPGGLSINSATGAITGTPASPVPASGSTSAVTVTAADSDGATGSVTFDIVLTAPLSSGFTAASGHFSVNSAATCMNDANAATADGSPVDTYSCESAASENWSFLPGSAPGGPGTIALASNTAKCLETAGDTSGSKAEIGDCDGGTDEQWQVQTAGTLLNPVSGLCLSDPGDATANNTQLNLESCTSAAGQLWAIPAGQILSAIGDDCLDDYDQGTANTNKIDIYQCNTSTAQTWTAKSDGTIDIQGKCLEVTSFSELDGGPLELYTCNGQPWTLEPNGEIVNNNSGKCLDDPGNTTTWGIQIEQWDCDGQPGEIWEVT